MPTIAPQRLKSQRLALPTLGRMPSGRTEERRGSAHDRGYGARWRRARAAYLRQHPLCVCCRANGRIVAATLVDHVEPHRGDMAKFWNSSNWQALDDNCHNRIKAVLEQRFEQGKLSSADLKLDRLLPEFFHQD